MSAEGASGENRSLVGLLFGSSNESGNVDTDLGALFSRAPPATSAGAGDAEGASSSGEDDAQPADDEAASGAASPQAKPAEKGDDSERKRTVFVGNVPNSIKRKQLERHFASCGRIESSRFRSAAFSTAELPRKAAFIKRQFHENRSTMNAYVVFVEEESIDKALKLHNSILEGNHIRVDRVLGSGEVDSTRSLFVGNCPFDAEEEDLRGVFSPIAEVTNVRVVRDKSTGMGKGFAFVEFLERSMLRRVMDAAKDEPISVSGRELRLTRASDSVHKKINKRKFTAQRLAKKSPGKQKTGRPGDNKRGKRPFQGATASQAGDGAPEKRRRKRESDPHDKAKLRKKRAANEKRKVMRAARNERPAKKSKPSHSGGSGKTKGGK